MPVPSVPGAMQRAALLRRTGTFPNAALRDDPGLAAHHAAKVAARCAASGERYQRVLARLARGLPGANAGAADQRGIQQDRRRLADEIALHRVAPLVGEEGELLLGFDAFGYDRHLEPMAEADHRADDRGRLRVAPEIHDKGAVDLDLVERERLQVAQRGIPAAEIVHRDAHAQRL